MKKNMVYFIEQRYTPAKVCKCDPLNDLSNCLSNDEFNDSD